MHMITMAIRLAAIKVGAKCFLSDVNKRLRSGNIFAIGDTKIRIKYKYQEGTVIIDKGDIISITYTNINLFIEVGSSVIESHNGVDY